MKEERLEELVEELSSDQFSSCSLWWLTYGRCYSFLYGIL